MKIKFLEQIMTIILAVGILYGAGNMANVYADKENKNIIIIDPGHGGSDPGMIGINNLQEKNINLEIAKKLEKELKSQGYIVIMTRTEDVGLYEEEASNKKAQDLQKRIEIIKKNNPALCVSIHQNSYQDEAVKGPQVFYFESSQEGKELAGIIQRKLNQDLQILRPRIEKGNATYYLLKRSPCVLNIVECGFLTNHEEAQLLQNEEYQLKLAHAVAEGICEYMKKKLLH